MISKTRTIQKKEEVKPVAQKQIPLAELTDTQLMAAIYQQEDTVARLRRELAMQEHTLNIIHSEGRKRAKTAETKG